MASRIDFLAGIDTLGLIYHRVPVRGVVGPLRAREGLFRERMSLSKGRHIRSQIVEPNFGGVVVVGEAARKARYLGGRQPPCRQASSCGKCAGENSAAC